MFCMHRRLIRLTRFQSLLSLSLSQDQHFKYLKSRTCTEDCPDFKASQLSTLTQSRYEFKILEDHAHCVFSIAQKINQVGQISQPPSNLTQSRSLFKILEEHAHSVICIAQKIALISKPLSTLLELNSLNLFSLRWKISDHRLVTSIRARTKCT